MKSIHKFIIELKNPYNEKFKTEGGVELYGNVDFTADRQSNRVAKVVGVPALIDTEIKENNEVLIDFTSFYRQTYQGNKQYYQNVVDAEKDLYYIDPNMIICYKNLGGDWIGYKQNSLVKPIFEEKNIDTTLILPDTVKTRIFTGKIKMIYANKELKEQGIKNNDTLYMNPLGGVKYWFDGKEYWWVRNRDLLGLVVEEKLDKEITFSKPTKKDFDSGKYTVGCDPYILDEVGIFPTNNSVSWMDVKKNNKMKKDQSWDKKDVIVG